MSTRYTVSRSRIDALLSALSDLDGFICLDTERGGCQRVSALPDRQWWFPDQPGPFADTVAAKLPMYIVRGLGGVLYVAGAVIMCYNLWMTVKRSPATAATNSAVPAE